MVLYGKYANILEPNDNVLSDVLVEVKLESCYLHISNTKITVSSKLKQILIVMLMNMW